MPARKRIERIGVEAFLQQPQKHGCYYKYHSSIAPWAVAGTDLLVSSGISARALLGPSAGFTLPYFELPERGCVLAPRGTTTPTLLLLAEQLGSTATTLKIVAIAVRLLITLNPFTALRILRIKIPLETCAPRMILHRSVAPRAPLLQSAPHAHESGKEHSND
jgi:hypothetical protein